MRVGAVPAAASIMRAKGGSGGGPGPNDDKLVNTSAGSIVRVRETGNQKPSRRAAWEQIQ